MAANPVKISYLAVTRVLPPLKTQLLPFSPMQLCLPDHHLPNLLHAVNAVTEHTTNHQHQPRTFQWLVPTATQSLQDVPLAATQATAAPHAIIATSTNSIAQYHVYHAVTT